MLRPPTAAVPAPVLVTVLLAAGCGQGALPVEYPPQGVDELTIPPRARTPTTSSTRSTTRGCRVGDADEPGLVEHKYYARGFGGVLERTVLGGSESLEPVEHTAG